jgi:hypothetical protein
MTQHPDDTSSGLKATLTTNTLTHVEEDASSSPSSRWTMDGDGLQRRREVHWRTLPVASPELRCLPAEAIPGEGILSRCCWPVDKQRRRLSNHRPTRQGGPRR